MTTCLIGLWDDCITAASHHPLRLRNRRRRANSPAFRRFHAVEQWSVQKAKVNTTSGSVYFDNLAGSLIERFTIDRRCFRVLIKPELNVVVTQSFRQACSQARSGPGGV